ncbi:hypothetical protein [Paenibacillus sp. MBLB4367]|uniref:hypothetical protein n=1 Tax=Paenibacillus sp. MBLB4367 TaxID=3384767 RepID=UPI003908346A
MNKHRWFAAAVLLVLSGCAAAGQESGAGTFAMAQHAASESVNSAQSSSGAKEDGKPTVPQQATPNAAASASPAAGDKPEPAITSPADAAPAASVPSAAEEKPLEGKTPAKQTPKPAAQAGPEAQSPAVPAAAASEGNGGTASKEQAAAQTAGDPAIKWSEFFDDEKQNTPSDKFWDLQGKTVTIKGYMGEVLSFEKHWFLLIPEPGAECPFDNGDETYWNKIMIVFVPDKEKLRYTSGPLRITGKLDVGIKIDESGYKTMFRLYDAKFEKIKE